MSPNLIILLQNVSLKAQLLEICSEIRNFGFATKDELTHAATKEIWQEGEPHCKVSEQIEGMPTVFISLGFHLPSLKAIF